MKPHLILVALLAGPAWGAQPAAPGPVQRQQQPSKAILSPVASGDSRNLAQRHLTDEERAELRRQIYQFSRAPAGKRK